MLQITAISAFSDNYIWLIREDNSSDCAVVDPGDAEPVIQYLNQNNLTLSTILLTHHHWDHTGGVKALSKRSPCIIHGPGLSETDGFQLFKREVKVKTIPGHTLDHIAFIIDDKVFCGDTLFSAGCGRVFEGTFPQMLDSLNKLKSLHEDTKIYCGHEYTINNLQFAQTVEPENNNIQDYLIECKNKRKTNKITLPSTIKLEKEVNPFFRCLENSVKTAAENFCGKLLPREVDVFAAIRTWKDQF